MQSVDARVRRRGRCGGISNLPPLHDVASAARGARVRFAAGVASLAAANKRVGNILKKAEGEVGGTADPARFVEAAETALFAALGDIAPRADAAFAAGDYTASLQALAALKIPVDAFFDQVMVNADDPALKANRLALLNQLHRTMNRVADLSRLRRKLSLMKLIILDRDGVINFGSDQFIKSPDEWKPIPAAWRRLRV